MAADEVITRAVLALPEEREARRYLQECSFDDRLVGVIMKASGTLPVDIYSIEQVLGFFAYDNSDVQGDPDAVIQGRRLDVAYLAPARLSRWIREIVGDAALADAIDAEAAWIEDPNISPPRMRLMRELVATRVLQYYDVVGIRFAADGVQADDDAKLRKEQ